MLDPEYRGVSYCHPYQFLEICIPLCNDPIGLIQKGHLNLHYKFLANACLTAKHTSVPYVCSLVLTALDNPQFGTLCPFCLFQACVHIE